MTIEALNEALGALQQSGAEMRVLRTTCPENWRKAYVGLRRQAQLAVQNIADAGEACFNAGTCRHLEGEFRNALNSMRSAIAFHQANWPAVAVDPQEAEYCASVKVVYASIRDFEDVVARMLSSGRAAA